MPNELFNGEEQTAPKQDQQQQEQENALFFVGEGKKFKSPEELDKAYGHANEHIAKLEEELAELRKATEQESSKSEAIEEVLKALRGEQRVQDQQSDQTKDHQQDSSESVEDVVRNILSQTRQEDTQKANLNKVREGLVAKYGDKAAQVYQEAGKSLGVDLDDLSRKSPDAVFKLLGVEDKPAQSNFVPNSTFNTANLKGNAPQPGTMEEIESLYKDKKISREEKFRRQWRLAMKN